MLTDGEQPGVGFELWEHSTTLTLWSSRTRPLAFGLSWPVSGGQKPWPDVVALVGQFRERRADLRILVDLRQAWLDRGGNHRVLVPPDSRPARPVVRQRQVRLDAGQVDDLVAGYEAGGTILELADQFGVVRTTVITHLDRRQIARRHLAGMSPDQVRQAAGLYQAGSSLASIGEALGFSPGTVRRYLAGAGVATRPRRGRS